MLEVAVRVAYRIQHSLLDSFQELRRIFHFFRNNFHPALSRLLAKLPNHDRFSNNLTCAFVALPLSRLSANPGYVAPEDPVSLNP